MQTIKTRAWCTKSSDYCDENTMVYDGYYIDSEGNAHWNYYTKAPELVLMQYTGLCDKNGKEICKSDLVSVQGSNEKIEIIFKEGAFVMGKSTASGNANLGDILKMIPVEVVGNIYESDLSTSK